MHVPQYSPPASAGNMAPHAGASQRLGAPSAARAAPSLLLPPRPAATAAGGTLSGWPLQPVPPPLAAAGQRLECAGGWPWHTSQPHEQQLLQMQPLRCSWLIGSNSPEMVWRRAATHAHSAARASRQRAQSHTQPVTGAQSQHCNGRRCWCRPTPGCQGTACVRCPGWGRPQAPRAQARQAAAAATPYPADELHPPLRPLPCLPPQKPLQRPAARQRAASARPAPPARPQAEQAMLASRQLCSLPASLPRKSVQD